MGILEQALGSIDAVGVWLMLAVLLGLLSIVVSAGKLLLKRIKK